MTQHYCNILGAKLRKRTKLGNLLEIIIKREMERLKESSLLQTCKYSNLTRLESFMNEWIILKV